MLSLGQINCLCAADIESGSSIFVVPALGASEVCRLEADGENAGERVYRSRTVSLRSDGRRAMVARCSIRTEGDIAFAVVTDEGREEFSVTGGGLREMSCSLRGRELRFEIRAEGQGHSVGAPAFEILSLD